MPSKSDVLEREFLPLRAKILEIAAALDRLDRAEESPQAAGNAGVDRRRELLAQALAVLTGEGLSDRAEQVQMLFSRPYDPGWMRTVNLPRARGQRG